MKKIQIMKSIVVLVVILTILIGLFLPVVQAGVITSASNTMSRLRVGVLSNHLITFVQPTGAGAGTTITVTFPAGFTMGTHALLNFDLGATAGGVGCGGAFTERTLAATASGTTWGVSQAAQTITFTSATDTIPANSCIRIRIGSNAITGGAGADQITNPGTAGSYGITIGGTFGSSGSITVHILTDEQVVVSATVPDFLTFSLGVNALPLGILSVATTTSASHTVSLATNASAGMVVTFSGPTLTSGAHTIAAMTTTAPSVVGTAQFGINAVANTTPTVGAACSGTAPIAAAAANYNTANNFRFVSGDVIVNSTGPINTTTCTISHIVNIAGITPAGIYTTTLTYIATATF